MPIHAGTGALSARAFGLTTTDYFGEISYTTPGTYSFVVPFGVTAISAVCVGGGGGGCQPLRFLDSADKNTIVYINNTRLDSFDARAGAGGGLAYKNSIAVTPGETLTIVVGAAGTNGALSGGGTGGYGTAGGSSSISRGATMLVGAGGGSSGNPAGHAGGGVIVGDGGGTGGVGGGMDAFDDYSIYGGGGGGAGGYAGSGGAGSEGNNNGQANGAGGGGGGAGGGQPVTYNTVSVSNRMFQGGGGGGGVGLLGQGSNGAAGVMGFSGTTTSSGYQRAGGGGGGSGGDSGSVGGNSASTANGGAAGIYGGGGGASGTRWQTELSTSQVFYNGYGGGSGQGGAIRIIWATLAGYTRAFPSTNVGQL